MRSSSKVNVAEMVYAKPNKGGKPNDAYTGSPDDQRRPITQDMVRVLPKVHLSTSQRFGQVPTDAENAGNGRRMSEPMPDYYDRQNFDYGRRDTNADIRRPSQSKWLDSVCNNCLVCLVHKLMS